MKGVHKLLGSRLSVELYQTTFAKSNFVLGVLGQSVWMHPMSQEDLLTYP
jgi:hypothetical protein